MEKLADEMLSKGQVKGILCSDESGLNVCNRGTLNGAQGDVAIELLKLASCLEPDVPMSSIVVHFTGVDGSSLSITNDGILTTAIHRMDKKR